MQEEEEDAGEDDEDEDEGGSSSARDGDKEDAYNKCSICLEKIKRNPVTNVP